MAVAGKLQPNEQIVYALDGKTPDFVRRMYQFTGLGSRPDGSAGPTIQETEIAVLARTADGDPLPPTDFTISGLHQSRVSVRRYSRARGSATIVVDWGIRFSPGGAGPDAKREISRTISRTSDQPYMTITRGTDQTLFETRTRSIIRPLIRTVIQRIISDDATATVLVDAAFEVIGKTLPWRGKNRLIVGAGFSPFSQTQGYIGITLDFHDRVDEVLEDEIVSDTGVYGSQPVAALDYNQQYGVPTGDGTPALPIPDSTGVFNWMVQ